MQFSKINVKIKQDLDRLLCHSTIESIHRSFVDGGYKTNNGPYCDDETSLRFICHFLVTLIKLKKIGSLKDNHLPYIVFYEKEIIKFLDRNGLFFRSSIKKDRTNGLMGPAWLLELSFITSNKKVTAAILSAVNAEVRLDKFPPEINGAPDFTFNHSLWFIYFAYKNKLVSEEYLQRFLYSQRFSGDYIGHYFGRNSKTIVKLVHWIRGVTPSRSKVEGYHYFNFIILNRCFKDGFYLKYSYDKYIVEVPKLSSFAYTYNPIGTEVWGLLVADHYKEKCWQRQIEAIHSNLVFDKTLLLIRLLEGVEL